MPEVLLAGRPVGVTTSVTPKAIRRFAYLDHTSRGTFFPLEIVEIASNTLGSIVWLMNRTEPSAKATLAPEGSCRPPNCRPGPM